MSSSALLSRLEAILESEMEHQELQLSPCSEQWMEDIVSIGVDRMAMDKVFEKQEMVHLAEENIKHLMEYLSDQAKTYRSFPYMEDLAFDMAMEECSPLWPYVCSSDANKPSAP